MKAYDDVIIGTVVSMVIWGSSQCCFALTFILVNNSIVFFFIIIIIYLFITLLLLFCFCFFVITVVLKL